MRYLFLTMGPPGVGKSTWIKESGLEDYSLSPDKIRLMVQSPIVGEDGNLSISQDNDKYVWSLLFEVLERRMQKGDFTIIDATHSRPQLINKYKKLADKYRYRITVIDFTDEDLDVVLSRNKQRKETSRPHKVVPEDVIRNAYSRLKFLHVPSGIDVIKPGDFNDYITKLTFFDFTDKYDRVVFVGDVHSMYTELLKLMEEVGEDDDTLYIFVGDYFDRGLYPAETFNWIMGRMYNRKNYIFLTGNHDVKLHLYAYYDDYKAKLGTNLTYDKFFSSIDKNLKFGWFYVSKSTIDTTFRQFVKAGITPKDVRKFWRKLGQIVNFKFGDIRLFGNHGGFPTKPSVFYSTHQFIEGVGEYSDDYKVALKWEEASISSSKITNERYIQVHGHRNINFGESSVDNWNHRGVLFNITGNPEQGSSIKAVEFRKDGTYLQYMVPVIDYKNRSRKYSSTWLETRMEEKDLYRVFSQEPTVRLREVGNNIYSVNFTKNTFYKRNWNKINMKARGLFIHVDPVTRDSRIVARSFDKFFNLNEVDETRKESIISSYKFPLYAKEKVNGYLGIVSVWNGEWFIATKSSVDGNYANWFRELFFSISPLYLQRFKELLQDNNASAIFEVVLPEKDPHIVEYKKDCLYLLSIVKNSVNFNPLKSLYYESVSILEGNIVKFPYHYSTVIGNGKELDEFISSINRVGPFGLENYIEGVVLYNEDNKMVKVKTDWYKFWRWAREFMKSHLSKRDKKEITRDEISMWTAKMHDWHQYEFFNFIKDRPDLWKKSIIEVRRAFFQHLKS